MSRKARPLTSEQLDELPPECRSCLFWELPDAPRGPARVRPDEAREAKELWHRSVELEWGPPGLLLYDGERVVGYAIFAPAEHARRARRLGSTPSEDALSLATMWIDPTARHRGHAKALLHAVLRHAHDAGFRAVEAVGGRGPQRSCVLPEAFLTAVGFVVHREHPRYPLLRLDLRQTARWQDAMEQALEGVRSVLVRRERQPAPSSV